jgi:hypothetical protein
MLDVIAVSLENKERNSHRSRPQPPSSQACTYPSDVLKEKKNTTEKRRARTKCPSVYINIQSRKKEERKIEVKANIKNEKEQDSEDTQVKQTLQYERGQHCQAPSSSRTSTLARLFVR